MTTPTPLRTFHVHLFPVVRVMLRGIQAPDHRAAVAAALNDPRADGLYDRFEAPDGDYAEEISHYLVDVAGDEEFDQSRWFYSSEEPLLTTIQNLVEWADGDRPPQALEALIAAARDILRCSI